jgi:microcystin-dependent protein
MINPWINNGVPSGSVFSFAGSVAPPGYLPCDGSVYLQSAYPELFAAIGTGWATCQNPTTGSTYSAPAAGFFRVPDTRGVLIRSVGTSVRTGGSASVAMNLGAYKDDDFSAHTHGYGIYNSTAATGGANGAAATTPVNTSQGSLVTSGTGGTETTPRCVGMSSIIKI